MTFGQPYMGTDNGPALLREAGLRKSLTHLGWRVDDNPDLDLTAENLLRQGISTDAVPNSENSSSFEDHPNAKNSVLVGRASYLISQMVETKARSGNFPLILGGDHSVAMGSLHGILKARPRTGVLWIDAHADLNTPSSSGSGNMHGMPLAMLMDGLDVDCAAIPGCEWMANSGDKANFTPKLHPDSLVYIGLRDVDASERLAIRELGILAFTMSDIDQYGIGRVMEMSLSHLCNKDKDRPLHLSFDIDAIDPNLAPATGTSVRGGLTYREAHYVAEAAASSGLLASADLVELNPTLADGSGARETIELGLRILTSLMGKSII